MLESNNYCSVGERIYLSAIKHRERIAILFDDKKVTYAEFNRRALQLAAYLNAKGLKGQNIGILTQRTLSAYVGVVGTLYAGCTYVPLNPKHPLNRLASIVKSANITTFIFDEKEHFDLERFIACVGGNSHIIYPEKDLGNIVSIKAPIQTNQNKLAYIMFTSGSTGEPKGVLVSHTNVCCHIDNRTNLYQIVPDDMFSQTYDLSFDPSVGDMFTAWFNGATVCVFPVNEIFDASDYIQRFKITYWASVPTVANFMLSLGRLKPNVFPTLRHSTFVGEPFPQLLAHHWSVTAPNSTIQNWYGPTEATVDITRHVYQKNEHSMKYRNGIVPIGRALPGQRIVIVNEKMQPVPDGEVGELCVSGTQVTLGYLNDPMKTDEVFVKMPWDHDCQNRWYKTGDLAFVNENGDIECLGRIDSQIKIGGQRVELGEIEAVLREITNTTEVAVVPAFYENGVPQKLVAFIAKKLTEVDIQEIQESCQKMLQSAFVPKTIYPLDMLPLNSSGKIDKLLLKKMALSMESQGTTTVVSGNYEV